MAAVASAAFPSTSRTLSTLPFSSTTSLRTTVPWASPEFSSTGYFGATLCASRFSAPLEERMITLFSRGNGASDEVAVAASFLLSLGLLASGLLTTGAAGIVVAEGSGATAVPGVAAGGTEAVAAADGVGEPVAESGSVGWVLFRSVGTCSAVAEVVAGSDGAGDFAEIGAGAGVCGWCAIPARSSTRSICGWAISRNSGWYIHAA